MTIITGPSVSCARKVTRISSPQISMGEANYISGFAFSKKMAKKLGVEKKDLINAYNKNPKAFKNKHAKLAKTIESAGAGGPTMGENYVKIWIDTDHSNAGSEIDYLWMYFGREKRVKLLSGGRFPSSSFLLWDLNDISDWLEDNIETDLWDEIALITDSPDGIKISRVCIIHSSQTILDWECNLWLDGSKDEKYGKLIFTAKILETKLGQIDNLWVPQIHWAAREIGKTDGTKYDADPETAWCSDFARWCLEKAHWEGITSGEIGTGAMDKYFKDPDIDRYYTKDQLLNREHKLVAGDYIHFKFPVGHHSGIFVEYIDDPSNLTEATTFRTIEGNYCSVDNEEHTVGLATRTIGDIESVGNCQ